MSDYMWAKIEIGGAISYPILTNLAEKFGVAPPLSEGTEAASPEASSSLVLEDDEAAYGMFEELEGYLVEQAVPFDRASDGGYEHSPELRRFRPCIIDGTGQVSQTQVDRTFLCDHDNRPVAAHVDIKEAIAGTQTRQELAARLVELCGLDIPMLPPVIVMEAAG